MEKNSRKNLKKIPGKNIHPHFTPEGVRIAKGPRDFTNPYLMFFSIFFSIGFSSRTGLNTQLPTPNYWTAWLGVMLGFPLDESTFWGLFVCRFLISTSD